MTVTTRSGRTYPIQNTGRDRSESPNQEIGHPKSVMKFELCERSSHSSLFQEYYNPLFQIQFDLLFQEYCNPLFQHQQGSEGSLSRIEPIDSFDLIFMTSQNTTNKMGDPFHFPRGGKFNKSHEQSQNDQGHVQSWNDKHYDQSHNIQHPVNI